MEASTTTPVEAQPSENWFRPLKDDRLEVCLRANGLRLRASGPELDVWALVEQFEQRTGVAIDGEWRPPEGQLTIDQLESGGDGEE